MKEIYRKDSKEGYQAFINGGCMNYRDAYGAYRVPVGSRTHFCLLTLEDNEQITRSLEIDLLTGNVYYRVDNHTDALLAYYYDISLTKVWNKRIYRLLLSIRDERLKPALEIKRALQKLPCADWKEVLTVIPGFEQALESCYDRLFLPYEQVETVTVDTSDAKAGRQDTGEKELILYEPIPGSDRKRIYTFLVKQENGQQILHYANENIGAEFFDEDEAYERVLGQAERYWVEQMFAKADDQDQATPVRKQLIRFLRRELEILPG